MFVNFVDAKISVCKIGGVVQIYNLKKGDYDMNENLKKRIIVSLATVSAFSSLAMVPLSAYGEYQGNDGTQKLNNGLTSTVIIMIGIITNGIIKNPVKWILEKLY